MTLSAARNDELADALALLYGHQPAALAENLAHAFRLVARGELGPDHLLVARANGALVGAVFCQPLPGASAVVWPPRAVGDAPAVEDALAAAAIDHVAGAKVVQTFLPPEELALATPLVRAGFRHVTRVWQMRRDDLSPPAPLPAVTATPACRHGGVAVTAGRGPGGRGFTLTPYPACDPAEFLTVLVRCHDDSADCPELHGVRTPEEMLAGYRDCAPDPARWWLAREGGEPVGVLILGDDDLSFVGVVPARRGHGIGRALVAFAVDVAPGLSLIVDGRNVQAVQLYRSTGFEVVGAREVFLYFPARAAGATPPQASRL